MGKLRRRMAVLAIACLLAAGCSGDDDPVVGSSPTSGAVPSALPGAEPDPSPAGGDDDLGEPVDTLAPAPPTTNGAPHGGATTVDPPEPGEPPALEDDGPLASMAVTLLSPSIDAAVVEVDATAGEELTTRAQRALVEVLGAAGGKQSVRFEGASTVPQADTYTIGDLRRLAAENRETGSSEDRVSIYVLVLDGRYENEAVTGVAFAASSFALFPDVIGGGLLGSASYPRFEEAVAVHELGHLFGLVNLTGQGAFHEDPGHPGHSINRGSVMFWAIEDVSIANLFRGGPPNRFDEDDERELDLIRSGG